MILLALSSGVSVAQRLQSPAGMATPNRATQLVLPGPRSDGSVLLPNQWSLRPAGSQLPMGDYPVNIGKHPFWTHPSSDSILPPHSAVCLTVKS